MIKANANFTAERRNNLVFVNANPSITGTNEQVVFAFSHDAGELAWVEPASLDVLATAYLINEACEFAKAEKLIQDVPAGMDLLSAAYMVNKETESN